LVKLADARRPDRRETCCIDDATPEGKYNRPASLTDAMRDGPDLVNDELRAYRDEADTEIRALEKIGGRPGSWAAH